MKLSVDQKAALEELWQKYGNFGPNHSIGNHKLLQKLIFEDSVELNPLVDRYNKMYGEKSVEGRPTKIITQDCLKAIKNILS